MKYGIKTVVGGFGRGMSAEEAIPYTLARTYIEHQALGKIIDWYKPSPKFKSAIEIGCGYGRNLPLLQEFSDEVYGIERDEELVSIAKALNPKCSVVRGIFWDMKEWLIVRDGVSWDVSSGKYYDLVLTFTFLQHLSPHELHLCAKQIDLTTAKNSLLVLCEETDPRKTDPTCAGRTLKEYQEIFIGFELAHSAPRKIEATFPGENSGTYMVFRKK